MQAQRLVLIPLSSAGDEDGSVLCVRTCLFLVISWLRPVCICHSVH